ncbi:MAG: hypothetical protein U0L51_01445 [Olegusella sp.]|nr:hypothetical protein [Olegusella sp.]
MRLAFPGADDDYLVAFDDYLVAFDDYLVAANNDDAVLRARRTRSMQIGELVVRTCELVVGSYAVVVESDAVMSGSGPGACGPGLRQDAGE